MDRPYIICHMVTSIDGRIVGQYLDDLGALGEEYENIHERYGADGWLCGRVTMEEGFTKGRQLQLSRETTYAIPRTDHVADGKAEQYAVAVDAHGKLGWTKSHIAQHGGRTRDHIVEVLAETVPDAYLSHLREIGISYIFGGRESLDFTLAAGKLKSLFGIEKLMLEGGGYINGSFLREDLIDEYSWLVAPTVEGVTGLLTSFESFAGLSPAKPMDFVLKDVQKAAGGGLWITYLRSR